MVSIPLRPASSNEKALPATVTSIRPQRSSATTSAALDSALLAGETINGFYDLRGFVSQWSNDKYRGSQRRPSLRNRISSQDYGGMRNDDDLVAEALQPPSTVSPDITSFRRINAPPTHQALGVTLRTDVRASSSSSSSNQQPSLKHHPFGLSRTMMNREMNQTNAGGLNKLTKIWNRDMYRTVKDAMTVTSYMKRKDIPTTWGDTELFRAYPPLHCPPSRSNHIPQQLQQPQSSPYSDEIRPRSWNRSSRIQHKPDRFTAPPITSSTLTMDNNLINNHQPGHDTNTIDVSSSSHNSNKGRRSARYHRKDHHHHRRHQKHITSAAPPTIVGKRLVTPRVNERYECKYIDEDKGGTTTIISPPTVKLFSYYETQNAPHRRTMEDGHIYNPSFITSALGPKASFIAVLDGHGGRRTAIDTVMKRFPIIIADGFNGLLPTSSRGDKKKKKCMKSSLCEAFAVMDEELRPFAWQHGLTATIILIKQQKNKSNKHCYTVICANVGDSRAILISPSSDKICRLTQDHRPTTNAMETDRIVNGGGVVLFGRVGGQLAVSRALGDWCLKNEGVISEPSISIKKDIIKGSIIVGASDGVWDVLSDKDVAQYVLDHIKEDGEKVSEGLYFP